MNFNSNLPFGATPLEKSEAEGLLLDISTHYELNSFEEANIERAYLWAVKSRKLKKELLSISGIKLLHNKMLCDVWAWAGSFRRSERNIGVEPSQIQIQVLDLCENVKYQIENEVSDIKEIAIFFHHQLTKIHPFPNGNGRHARLATDLLLKFNNIKPFKWSGSHLRENKGHRKEYIEALRVADREFNLKPLLQFAERE